MYSKPSFGTSNTNTFGFTGTTNVSNGNPFIRPTSDQNTLPSFSNQSAATFGQQPTSLFGPLAAPYGTPFGNQQNSNFGKPVTQPPTFGSGTFSSPSTQPAGSMFDNMNDTFNQQNTTGFAFGTTSLNNTFPGQQNNLFQQTLPPEHRSNNLFGSTEGFTSGTVVKFKPILGTDIAFRAGIRHTYNTRHYFIGCMKEYDGKSLEELRWEDYQANRKGESGNQPFEFGRINQPVASPFAPTTSANMFQTENKMLGSTAPALWQTNTNTPANTSASGLFGKPLGFETNNSNNAFTFNPIVPMNPFTQNTKPFVQTQFNHLFGQPTQSLGSFGTTNNTNFLQQKPAVSFNMGSSNTGMYSQSYPTTTLGSTIKPNVTFKDFGSSNISPVFRTFGQNSPLFNTVNKPIPIYGQNNQAPPVNMPGIGHLFGTNAQQPSNVSGYPSNTLSNSCMSTVSPSSLQPASQNTFSNDSRQWILAMTATPFGLSPFLRDGFDHIQDIKERTKPTNQQEIQQLLTTVKKTVNMPEPTRKCSRKQMFGRAFVDLDQEEMYKSQHVFSNCTNPKRLILRHKNLSVISQTSDFNILEKNELEHNTVISSEIIDKLNGNYGNLLEQVNTKSDGKIFNLQADDITDFRPENSSQTSKPNINCHVDLDTEDEKYEDAVQYLDKLQSDEPSPETIDDEVTETSTDNKEETFIEIIHSKEPHPTGIILTRPEYYTKPTLNDLINYISDGSCVVQGFTVGRIGYGNVRFTEAFDVSNLNLDELVYFRNKEINIYPDESKKPPIGQGLNRKAQVTLDKVWPYNKKKKHIVRDAEKLLKIDYAGRLNKLCEKQNTKFVEYRPETGSWVFIVEHFSKYGQRSSGQ